MSTACPPRLDWLKRPRYDETLCARRTIYETRDGLFRVVHSRPTLPGLAPLYYAMTRDAHGWRLLSKHRKKRPALHAVESFAREEIAR